MMQDIEEQNIEEAMRQMRKEQNVEEVMRG
jgi:hypothetical protein